MGRKQGLICVYFNFAKFAKQQKLIGTFSGGKKIATINQLITEHYLYWTINLL